MTCIACHCFGFECTKRNYDELPERQILPPLLLQRTNTLTFPPHNHPRIIPHRDLSISTCQPSTQSSIPLPRRLRAWTPTRAPLIPAPHPQPLLRTQLQLPIQLITRILPMDEIAEPASHAPLPAIEPTTRLAEIGDGRELAVDGARGVPARVEGVAGFLRRVFVLEACVDVTDKMIVIIITDNHLLNLAKLAHLAPKVLVESIKVVLQLAGVHLDLGVVGRVLVEVGEQDGLAVRRLDVFAGAAVAVAACADLVVEGAVDFVGFGTEDAGEVVRHCVSLWSGLRGELEGGCCW